MSAPAEPILRVLVWDERQPEQREAYGDLSLGETIAAHIGARPGIRARVSGPDDPEQGLGEAELEDADVIVWWGHRRHLEIRPDRAEAVTRRILEGRSGFAALHSAHWSRPFVRLMQERAKADAAAAHPEAVSWECVNHDPIGVASPLPDHLTPHAAPLGEGGRWRLVLPQCVFPVWRKDGAPGHLTTRLPEHPIARGLPRHWDIPRTEMYAEPFHVPEPDAVIFEERWDRGEWFRSGCVWQVGKGRVFYFRPGHETYPVFRQAEPLRVLENAVRWLGESR
jgi:trehalose utilization protein